MQAYALVDRIESKTFLHYLLDHLHHFTMGRSLNPRCVIGQCRDEEGKRREEKERGGGLGVHTGIPQLLQAPIKMALLPPFYLPLFPTYFPLFTAILKDSPSLVWHTGNRPHRHLRWLVAKHCCTLNNSKTQTRLTPPPPREVSSQLENTTTHDTRRSIKAIDQRLFTLMSPTRTLIVSKVCGESELPLVWILQSFCSRC